jgi:hypothetical protein
MEQTNPDKGLVEGSIDWLDDNEIAGWAWDGNQPDSAVKVNIYDGDTLLATVTADQFRPDLAEAKKGNGKHAFSFPTPDSLKDGQTHTIRVKTSATGVELDGSPKKVSTVHP